ncbi:PAS domain S-box protein [Amycolatopsis sp. YIM 10]|uniref:PAS domain-containing sensor histidine kinase n=1 Tax=Amycolatopsis sp. YIM 10 TaxID=2653857 RepID=UPI0012907CA5|nr:PAS domain S-box protein [Amycolatopsis sp. YIM 10]QFU88896.1 Oxygen sensor histidine kinase NreB [Amycolatopsis sp. YIM 10]
MAELRVAPREFPGMSAPEPGFRGNDPLSNPYSGESFRLFVQSVQDYAIFMLDPQGNVATWNAGAERIKGYRANEIIGKHFSVFYPPEDLRADKPAHELEVAAEVGRFEDEGWRVRQDGSRFWAVVVITALFDEHGRLRGFGKVTRDVSERVRAESELVERRRLFFHLVEAQEAERRRIAWDVHDDSIQAMAAVSMRLQLLGTQVPDEHRPAVRALDTAVSETIGRLRDLVLRLRPPTLDERDLTEAVGAHLRQLADQGIETRLDDTELIADPPPEASVTIFRIVGEALTNVQKHARASRARVRFRSIDQGTLTEITDDGVGTDVVVDTLGGGGAHFGLQAMRERAEAVGGWWELISDPGEGALVRFWIPDGPGGRATGEES